ncbi:MAG: hypothetical protein UT70_C0014G0025, partial [Candidatus Nomurabacteria bacterium GW2011_GWE2_40_10]
MKKVLSYLFALTIVPTVAVSFVQSDGVKNQSQPVAISRPYAIQIIGNDGKEEGNLTGLTSLSDPFDISETLGAKPNIEDRFAAFPEIRMGIGSKITIYRAPTFEIVDGKRKKEIRS